MHRRVLKLIVDWGRSCWREATTCRACDHRIKLLDDTCASCGTAHPGRVPIGAVVVLSLPILLILAYACC
jgi:hypothetical protein